MTILALTGLSLAQSALHARMVAGINREVRNFYP